MKDKRGMRHKGGVTLITEIVPMRTDGLDQRNFPLPEPALQFFLSGYGCVDIAEQFEIHELAEVVARRETGDEFLLMLENAALEVVGNANVEHAGCARHDVNRISLHVVLPFTQREVELTKRDSSLRSE